MSVNRRLKRVKYPSEKEKPPVKLTFKGIVLVAGIITLFLGIFYGIYNYNVYTYGRPEHTVESKGGPIYYPEEAPGNPRRKESAAAGWKIAGIGALLIVLSVVIYIVDKVRNDAIDKSYISSGSK